MHKNTHSDTSLGSEVNGIAPRTTLRIDLVFMDFILVLPLLLSASKNVYLILPLLFSSMEMENLYDYFSEIGRNDVRDLLYQTRQARVRI